MTRPGPCHVLACLAFLGAAAGPAGADVWDTGAATNDNTPSATENELVHGLEQVHDLAAREGVPDEDYYVIEQGFASFEAIVDSTSADVGGIFQASNFVRLDFDGTTVVQQSSSTWGTLGTPGFSRALRWLQGNVGTSFKSYLRVRSLCGAACTSQDTYRIRFYDTTLSIPRFNNSGTQSTVLIMQNTTGHDASGEIHFISGSPNATLFTLPFHIPRYETLVTNTALVPELRGKAGSALVAHDAGYGQLTGKAVAVEPATGFVFESPLVPRPH